MKTEHIIITGLIIVILGLTAMIVLKEVQTQSYQQGLQDAQVLYDLQVYQTGQRDARILINQGILNDLATNGFITFTWIENNQTQRINLAPVQS